MGSVRPRASRKLSVLKNTLALSAGSVVKSGAMITLTPEQIIAKVRARRDAVRDRIDIRYPNGMQEEAEADFSIAEEYDRLLEIMEGRASDWD